MSISGPSSAFDSETFGQDASFHLEQPIGSMTISPSGRDVALASKEGLHIIDLDSPYSPPRHLPHRTQWEVADVQWSPFASRDYWVVSTSNQKALVWNLDAKYGQDSIQHVLHGHRRAITDINFSAHNPDILATCAVDSFVHCWDLRASGRPAVSFSDWFAAATQVKWSRQDEHVLASSHDKFLHIWDTRKGAMPVRTIEAHNTRIYGLDWNRFQRNKLVTCSLDRTIKFWNTDDPADEPERIIETLYPVWRARHTPFGWGMVAMPQRGSGSLYMYDRRSIDGNFENGKVSPVAMFTGHHGQVKEFLWRSRGGFQDGVDQRDFQLISWGTDRELRLHRIEPEALENVGYEKGVSKSENLNYTRRGARYVTFRDLPDDEISPAVTPHRGESLGSQQQLLAFRKRNSTTVGMSKVPVAQIKGWVSSQRRSSRIAMHGKASAANDVNPIAWLKNVKIASWDLDTLAEEIRHVGEKFKRVRFEAVDIKHRKLIMSLQAPWAEHQNAVYLRVDVRFPQSYPRHAHAVITLQKTSVLSDELHATLSAELHTIAEVHCVQQRGCLEAMLRYLLREQSLEQVIAYARGDSLGESKTLGAPADAEDSSDSDDDQITGLGAAVASAANIRVPLAKGCGAVWSETGRLVCFFPPKAKEPTSVLAGLSLYGLDRSDTSKLFEGFGKLHVDSPVRRATDKTRTTTDENDSGSDSSGSLLSSSSSSSSSSASEADLPATYAPYHKRLMAFPQRTKSIDFSNRSTTLAGVRGATMEETRQTVVSIKDFDDLIPSKRMLAEKYRILGDGPLVCKHNAMVAEKANRADLASVWLLASKILARNVPLEVLKSSTADEDIVLVARTVVSRLHRKDSGVDLSHDQDKHQGQTRWGANPLAATYLVPAMFDYFERIADVQMLAMLSCVFYESSQKGQSLLGTSSGTTLANANYFPSSTVAEAVMDPPPPLAEWITVSHPQRRPLNRLLSAVDNEPLFRSRRGTAMSLDPSTSSYRESDGRWQRTYSTAASEYDRHSANVSLSTSPEGGRHIQHLSTNSAAQASLSALTQSFSHSPPTQPSSGSQIASSLKKYSPSGSLTPAGWGLWTAGHGTRATRASIHHSGSPSHDKETSLRSSASLANLRSLRRSGHTTPEVTRRDFRSIAPSEASDSTRKGRRKNIKTMYRNQDHFDIDTYAMLPYLDQSMAWKYSAFRTNYAAMLDAWDLPIQRAEMLDVDTRLEMSTNSTETSPTKRSKSLIPEVDDTQRGLRIRRCCPRCANILAAVEKNGVAIGWHCISPQCLSNTSRPSKRSICSICHKRAQLAVPCLQCNHLVCIDCAPGWYARRPNGIQQPRSSVSTIATAAGDAKDFATDEESSQLEPESSSCPTGCGCMCPTLNPSQIHVPEPIEGLSTVITSPDSATSDRSHLIPPDMARTVSQLSTVSQDSQKTARTSQSLATPTQEVSSEGGLGGFFNLTGVRSRAGSKVDTSKEASAAILRSAKGKSKSITGRTPRSSGELVRVRYESVGGGATAAPVQGQNVDIDSNDTTREEKEKEAERILNPWTNSKFASLGRGVGGGLSRGLKERGSDSTIRGGK